MSSSAITTQVAQLKIGNVQNQADSTSVYSAGQWSFKNSTALTSVTITDAGNVGIGTASPNTYGKFVVASTGAAQTVLTGVDTGNGFIQYWGATGRLGYIGYGDLSANLYVANDKNAATIFTTNATERMRIDASGNLLVGTSITPGNTNSTGLRKGSDGQFILVANSGGLFHQALNSYYTVTTSGGSTSDANLKKEVKVLSDCLDKVKKLRGVSFEFIDEPKDDANKGKQIGVIAQEVEAEFPEMVVTNDEGVKAVRYEKLVAPLIEAIKELSAKNEALEARLAALESKP